MIDPGTISDRLHFLSEYLQVWERQLGTTQDDITRAADAQVGDLRSRLWRAHHDVSMARIRVRDLMFELSQAMDALDAKPEEPIVPEPLPLPDNVIKLETES